MKWIKKPNVVVAGIGYINLEQIADVDVYDTNENNHSLYFYTGDGNTITWIFPSSESLQIYIKENLERYMEVMT